MHILIKLATRERPAKALEVLRKYQAMESGNHLIGYLVSIDEDDHATLAVKEEIGKLAQVCVGRSISKIHACNRNIDMFDEWDILVLISDDMIPIVEGWDDRIALAMAQHHPDLDGCLHFNDGHTGTALCTLPIMGRKAYDKTGCVYNPEYLSLWCDNEWTEYWKAPYIPEVIIEHQHPSFGKVKADDLNKRNDRLDAIDRATYRRRKAAGWPHVSAQPDLTIGICTVPGREVRLEALMSILREQVKDAGPSRVEIIIEHDDGSEHTGTKRQKILDKANGRFVSFIDDDDLVSIHYVSRILASIEANPYQDAIGFTGRMTTNGVDPRTFVHELTGNPEWRTEGLVYYRTPGHLNPVRIDLARRVGYKAMTYGEDMRFCKDLFPLLKVSEMLCGDPMYFYLYDPKNSEASKRKNKPTPDGQGAAATVTPEPKQELRARPRKEGIRM